MDTITTIAAAKPLRQRMQQDMMMRGLLPRTQDSISATSAGSPALEPGVRLLPPKRDHVCVLQNSC